MVGRRVLVVEEKSIGVATVYMVVKGLYFIEGGGVSIGVGLGEGEIGGPG